MAVLLAPLEGRAGGFSNPAVEWHGSATGSHGDNGGANLLDNMAIPNGGSLPIPADAAALALSSRLEARTTNGNATASITDGNGSVTYGFAWVPDSGLTIGSDPPPAYAIVKIGVTYGAGYWVGTEGDATLTGEAKLKVTPKVNDDANLTISNPVDVDYTQTKTVSGGDSISGGVSNVTKTSYYVVAPVPDDGIISVELQFTASTNVVIAGDRCRSPSSATVTMTPSVTVSPVTINLAGTVRSTDDCARNILVGQSCTATVSSPGYSQQNVTWSVTGPAFKHYVIGPASAHPAYLQAGDLEHPSVTWCYYAGSAPGDSHDVGVYAELYDGPTHIDDVVMWRPAAVWTPECPDHQAASGQVYWRTLAPGYWTDVPPPWPNAPALAAGQYEAGPGKAPGMRWGCTVKPQDLFNCAGAGAFAFVQLITPKRYRQMPPAGAWHVITDTQQGVDGGFPYAFTQENIASQVDDGASILTFVDSPGMPLQTDFLHYWVDNESLAAYIMYFPKDAGQGHEWVPLRVLSWGWSGDVIRQPPTWISPNGGDSVDDPYTVADPDDSVAAQHPEWDLIADLHWTQ